MNFEHLEACRASFHDMDEIMRLQAEGDAWNLSKGHMPLSHRYPLKERREFLERHLAESEIHLLKDKSEAVGMVRIQWKDPIFWGDAGWDPLAAYVHGLTIGQAWHGEGLGRWILGWAERFIKGKGLEFCRLDCMEGNSRLCAYYASQGYQDKGLVTLKSGWISRKFEKPLA
jgi:GNAT superfamily N-acetyltransferase